MKQLISLLVTLIFLSGCQDRTGVDWLDPPIVRDFDKRVDLTIALRRAGYSYCEYGCDHVCLIVPEPSAYRELDEQNFKKMSELRDRAGKSGLVFDIQGESGIIYDPRKPPDLSPEEIAPAILACVQRHRRDTEKIEILLDRLTPTYR